LRAVTRRLSDRPGTLVTLVAPPLIHATGLYTALGTLLAAGTVVFPEARTYDPEELAALMERYEVTNLCLVGDVFAAPFADVLDRAAASGHPYRFGALREIRSVGVTWSPGVKRRLLDHADVRLVDVIAASEGGPFASAVTTRSGGEITSTFELLPGARVIDEYDRDVRPGEVGRLAAPCADDAAYLGDPARTASTFRLIDGVRHTVPGDLATIGEDGALVLLGRAGRVINTGGEKVFAEEVEQVIAAHPAVSDVAVLGVPDARWGHRVTAVVSLVPGAALTPSDIQATVASQLAGYKKPRTVVFTPRVPRTPAGKLDLRQARTLAEQAP
jgi:fatty-acyl-CoA synthase